MARRKKKQSNGGLIIGFLDLLSLWFMKYLGGGLIGKLFTSYDKIENKAKNGILMSVFYRHPEGREKSIRRRLLKYFDESLLVNRFKQLVRALCSARFSVFGTFFAVFSVYSIIMIVVRSAVENGGTPAADIFAGAELWGAVVILVSSLFALGSSKSLLGLVSESRLMRGLLEDVAGIPEDKFDDGVVHRHSKSGYFVAVILGMLTSALTYYVSPLSVINVLALAVLVLIFLSFPEVGVIVTIAAAPFLGLVQHPTIIMTMLVGVTSVSYVLKLIVGKRIISVRLVDIAVFIFTTLIFFGGVITSGGMGSLESAIMYTMLMMIYFLVVNLMNTEEWLRKCLAAVAIPSALIAVIGILGYLTVNMPTSWIDSEMFSYIGSRAVSTFDNPNMLATYLILTAPFIWYYLIREETSASGRIIALIGSAASLACTVLTWSRGGWLGMLAAMVLFLFANYKHVFRLLIVVGASAPLWPWIIPGSVVGRFASIGNLADSSTYYRLYTWKGTFRMLSEYYAGGIGVGQSAFSQIYPMYAYVGTEITAHSHNLLLEIAVELGVVGVLVFVIAIFMISQRGFGCMKYNSNNRSVSAAASAAMAGLTAALVHGLFDYVWYNYRVFFMFWVVAAMICAIANVHPKKLRDAELYCKDDTYNEASLDMIFGKKNDATL